MTFVFITDNSELVRVFAADEESARASVGPGSTLLLGDAVPDDPRLVRLKLALRSYQAAKRQRDAALRELHHAVFGG